MALSTTNTYSDIASLNSYLPPLWESTFMLYLVLPSLCAFLLFLLIFVVAFRLVKTNKYTDDNCNHYGHNTDQSSGTSIYEVINETLHSSTIQNDSQNAQCKPYPHSLQVCLPTSGDFQPPKFASTRTAIVQPSVPFPCVLHPSLCQGEESKYYDVTGLVNYIEDGTFPDCVNRKLSGVECSVGCSMVNDEIHNFPIRDRNDLCDEYPIYESLNRTWGENNNNGKWQESGIKTNVSAEIVSFGSKYKDIQEKAGEASDHQEEKELSIQDSDCTRERDVSVDGYSESKPTVYTSTQKNHCNSDGPHDKVAEFCGTDFDARSGRVECKLSVIIGPDEHNNSLNTTVKNYYYKTNIKSQNTFLSNNQNWADKLNLTRLFLTSENQNNAEVNDHNIHDLTLGPEIPFKLELVNSTHSLSDLTSSENDPKKESQTDADNVAIKSESESCENLHIVDTPSNHYPRRKSKLKKSQSFKESGRYKKSGRGRKLSLEALSLSQKNPYGAVEQQHHRSFDKLEVERILARLGPLPPTPTPPQTAPPPSSLPPSLAPPSQHPPTYPPTIDENKEGTVFCCNDQSTHKDSSSLRTEKVYPKSCKIDESSNSKNKEEIEDTSSSNAEDTICSIILPGKEIHSLEPVKDLQIFKHWTDDNLVLNTTETEENLLNLEDNGHYFILENQNHCSHIDSCTDEEEENSVQESSESEDHDSE